ncbi:AraC family transcriptional regulator [Pseudosporangium ferrugineum]|uniref:AraC family transcriptional regulator n=2 Tax=Pseudosporangium ferrugineum TaxID=439699 RepID=A0A2T0SFL0_9ACTN|nr:AraC family transcriptional regulator [Pseudosporangium ferrugineum]
MGAVRALKMTTSDLDQAGAILGRHFYANDIDPLAPAGRWEARFDVTPAESVVIGDLRFGRDVRIAFGDLGAYHVDVPLSGELLWRQGDGGLRTTGRGSAAVFQPEGATVLERWNADCRLLAVKIDRVALEDQLSRMLDAPVPRPLRFGPGFDVGSGPGSTWARLIRLLATDAGQQAGLIRHPLLGRSLRESVLTGLLLAADHPYRDRLDDRRPVLAAPRAVRRAVEAMRDDPARPFTLSDLADIGGVGERSLQYGFRRYVGVTPMAYLRKVRLRLVHEELRASGASGATVTEIAYRNGFVHLGRFAAAYRAEYGVPPSHTLRG